MHVESQLGKLFRDARKSKSLRTGRLAGMAGRKNLAKGAGWIQSLEAGGWIQVDFLYRLADVLDIDRQKIDELIAADHRLYCEEWTAWANQPVRPYVVVCGMPAVYSPVRLPEHVQTIVEARDFTVAICRRWKHRACLVANRQFTIWFAADGTVETVTEVVPCKAAPPYIGNTTCQVDLGPDMILPFIRWPKKETTDAEKGPCPGV